MGSRRFRAIRHSPCEWAAPAYGRRCPARRAHGARRPLDLLYAARIIQQDAVRSFPISQMNIAALPRGYAPTRCGTPRTAF
ncbi:hypothetical protein HMPREF0762_00946 [Slackia exigua ATCC 700122]|uniref:Uncharacterized protein n=1 Tax=Slackia exigua (strain ATCC 700122 / DSM 15923 / CIP 105133 / JCM 11022 / KCTC 5966 / S-7) TaxID=649764 RepID=D0WGJ2_SLAES|nr:hypothetical protein HMPREF0762_00946 [Slackia exigua ATCC 700122]